MIAAVTQTLAEILAGGSSLIATEQIDFNHPGADQEGGPMLNLYCYGLQESQQRESSNSVSDHCSPLWFDLSFLVTSWDVTALGEQRLLSEALNLLLHYQFLPEDMLVPELRGRGHLPMKISAGGLINTALFWSALGIPIRPALSVTVTIPFDFQGDVIQPKQMLLIT